MQASHWKITKKTLKPPTPCQRFQLRKKSVEVLEDFLRPRTASLHHTLSTKPSSTFISRQGSIPGQIDKYISLIAGKKLKRSYAVAVPNCKNEENPIPAFPKVTFTRSKMHSYSLADSSPVCYQRCSSVQEELPTLQAPSPPSSLLASIQTQLDSHLSGLQQEKASIQLILFEPWGIKSSAIKAFAALRRGDWEAVKKLVVADKTLVRAVDAVSAK